MSDIYATIHAVHIADAVERITGEPVVRDLTGMEILGRRVRSDELQLVAEDRRSQFRYERKPTGRQRIRVGTVADRNRNFRSWSMGWRVMKSFPPQRGNFFDYEAIAQHLVEITKDSQARAAVGQTKKDNETKLARLLGGSVPSSVTVVMGEDPTCPVKSITLRGPFTLKLAARLIAVPEIINQPETED